METERLGYGRAASFCHGRFGPEVAGGPPYIAIKLFLKVSFTVRPSGSR